MIFGLIAIGSGLVSADALGAVMGQGEGSLTYLDSAMAMGVLLATFWGLWLGVWLVTKLLHRRGLSTVFGHDGRIRLDQFVIGMAMAAGYLALSLGSTWLSGAPPERSSLPMDHWLLAFAPLVALIFFQTAGEELFFRGLVMGGFRRLGFWPALLSRCGPSIRLGMSPSGLWRAVSAGYGPAMSIRSV
jgi:membrane protease YdiL (CAAX protease family)